MNLTHKMHVLDNTNQGNTMNLTHKMHVLDNKTRKSLFSGTQTQCEFFVEEMGLRIVADCPMGLAMYVR